MDISVHQNLESFMAKAYKKQESGYNVDIVLSNGGWLAMKQTRTPYRTRGKITASARAVAYLRRCGIEV